MKKALARQNTWAQRRRCVDKVCFGLQSFQQQIISRHIAPWLELKIGSTKVQGWSRLSHYVLIYFGFLLEEDLGREELSKSIRKELTTIIGQIK